MVGELGRFGQRLSKAELGLEAAGGKVALIVQLAGVGDPLVDEDQAGAILVEELTQRSAAAIRSNASLPPSCHASSPQSVRTTVPSAFVTGFPGEILLPTSTTRRALPISVA